MHVDVRFGDREVVRRRQPLLLRAVLRVRLHVLAEDIAGDGGDDLVRRDRAEPADRVAAHREAAGRPEVGVLGALERERVIDADAEVILPVRHHVVEGRDDVAGANVAAAEAGCAVVDARDAIDLLLPVLPGEGVAERRLDLARQVVAGGRERVVHPLEHRDGVTPLESIHDRAAPGTAGRRRPTGTRP